MSVSSRRRPRRQRRGGRGHSQSAAFRAGRASGRGRCASGPAEPGRARGGGRFVRGAASPTRPGPGWAGQLRGALAAAAPGRLHFVRGARRAGNAAPRSGRFVSRVPAAAGVGRGRRGGCAPRGRRGTCEPRRRVPARNETAWRAPGPLRAYKHAAIWRLARPGLAPKVGREPWRLHGWFQSPVLGGREGLREQRIDRAPADRPLVPKVYIGAV